MPVKAKEVKKKYKIRIRAHKYRIYDPKLKMIRTYLYGDVEERPWPEFISLALADKKHNSLLAIEK